MVVRAVDRGPAARLRERSRYATAAAALFAAVAMLAVDHRLGTHGVAASSAAPAQLAMLRRLAVEPHLIASRSNRRGCSIRARSRRASSSRRTRQARVPAGALGGARMPFAGPRTGWERSDQPLVTLPWLPAGHYRIRPRTRGPGGWMMLGIAQDQFSIWSGPIRGRRRDRHRPAGGHSCARRPRRRRRATRDRERGDRTGTLVTGEAG